MEVENLNGYANQFIISEYSKLTFQSYKTKICSFSIYNTNELNKTTNHLLLYSDMWDYSVTTRRHFKAFINQYTSFTYKDRQQWLKEIENDDLIEVE